MRKNGVATAVGPRVDGAQESIAYRGGTMRKNGMAIARDGFENETATLPITMSAGEVAGLNLNASGAGDPYGADALTDGAFANWSGGELDDWVEYQCDAAEVGPTGTAQLTLSGDTGAIYENATVTPETRYLLTFTHFNNTGDTARYTVTDITGSAIVIDYTDLPDVQTPTVYRVEFTTPAGCVTLQVALRGTLNGDIVFFSKAKLLPFTGPASCLLSEMDREERANGTALWDAAASVFTSGTYAWERSLDNTIANVSNELEITYVNNNQGAKCNLNNAADLSVDLTVGERYQLLFDAYYSGGSSGVGMRIVTSGDPATVDSSAFTTTKATYIMEFVAGGTTNCYLRLHTMGAGNVVYLDNIYFQKMQPTITTKTRVDWAETVLDTSYVDYSAGADLVVVKDGTSVTVTYDGNGVTTETVSDSEIIYNKIHSGYGDSSGTATIVRL